MDFPCFVAVAKDSKFLVSDLCKHIIHVFQWKDHSGVKILRRQFFFTQILVVKVLLFLMNFERLEDKYRR